MSRIDRIALLGLGEVGRRLADDLLKTTDAELVLWDRQFPDAASTPSLNRARLAALARVHCAEHPATLGTGCRLVISAVTASENVAAAKSIVAGLEPGAWFLDLNSVSPGTKRSVFAVIDGAGGRYLEAAIMSPIAPGGIGSPILLAGPHAQTFEAVARQLGFAGATACSDELGRASATKMCRSVIIKGLEALVTESLLAAAHYGVTDDVLASLANLLPHPDWSGHALYLLSRSLEHGARRSEEMQEVARTVQEAGITPLMSSACAERQAWAARFAGALREQQLEATLAALRAELENMPMENPHAGH